MKRVYFFMISFCLFMAQVAFAYGPFGEIIQEWGYSNLRNANPNLPRFKQKNKKTAYASDEASGKEFSGMFPLMRQAQLLDNILGKTKRPKKMKKENFDKFIKAFKNTINNNKKAKEELKKIAMMEEGKGKDLYFMQFSEKWMGALLNGNKKLKMNKMDLEPLAKRYAGRFLKLVREKIRKLYYLKSPPGRKKKSLNAI